MMPSIEQHGVDIIPDAERTSRPFDLISMLIGSNLCLGIIVFGWLPVAFGLSFWPATTSLVVGTLVGTMLVAPLALISRSTGTNLSTSSGAAFGVHGRLIGSFIGLLLSLGYIALTMWTGGDVIMGIVRRVTGISEANYVHAIVYALLAISTIIGAIYGYRFLLGASKILAIGMIILLAFGLMAYSDNFNADAPANYPYLLGSFWPTWLLSTVSAGLSGPIAFITLLGDYTRYISPHRHSSKTVLWATSLGLCLGLLIPQLFGTYVACAARASMDFATSMVNASPSWYLMPLLLAASAGSIGNAGVMLYSMGLDLDSIFPRLSRPSSTLVVALMATLLVFIGHFVWNAQEAMTSFVLLLTAIGTPWAVIMLIAHIHCAGYYDANSLQAFNRREKSSIYWFYKGWNIYAVAAWILGSIIGLCSVSTPLFEGPAFVLTGNVDFSFVLSGLTAGAFYTLILIYDSGKKYPRLHNHPLQVNHIVPATAFNMQNTSPKNFTNESL